MQQEKQLLLPAAPLQQAPLLAHCLALATQLDIKTFLTLCDQNLQSEIIPPCMSGLYIAIISKPHAIQQKVKPKPNYFGSVS